MWQRGSAARRKGKPLEKDKASGASKDWSLCPLELIQALLELLHATCSTAADMGSTGTSKDAYYAICSEKCQNLPFLSRNINIQRFGPIALDYAPGDFLLLAFLLLEKRLDFNYACFLVILQDIDSSCNPSYLIMQTTKQSFFQLL